MVHVANKIGQLIRSIAAGASGHWQSLPPWEECLGEETLG